MANLVSCLAMSHGPQLLVPPDKWGVLNKREWDPLPLRTELEKETPEVKWEKWRRCMSAIEVMRQKLSELSPDAVLVVGDDQHENILDDNMPPFTVYIGEEAEASTSLRYFNEPHSANRTKYKVHSAVAESILNGLMESGFDPAYSKKTRYAGGLGHAFARPLKFLTPDARYPVVPIMVNTYYPPAPTALRCVEFGKALASAIHRYPGRERIVILGSGGLSHTKIEEELDSGLLDALQRNDAGYLAAMPSSILVEGTSEIRNWIVTAAAADQKATIIEYQPLYRTPTGVGCAMGFASWKMN